MNSQWKKTFAFIFSGQIFSILTSAMAQFSIIWHLTETTGSARVLMLAGLAGFLPQALLGPFIGVWLDRWNRKLTMIAADSAIALTSLTLGAYYLWGGAELMDRVCHPTRNSVTFRCGRVLVSGFTKPLPGLPMLDEFTQEQIDYSEAAALASRRAVIASKDDPIVPVALSKELAQVIHAAFHEVEHGGHFLDSDGFTTLPIAYDILRDMIGNTD